MADLTSQADIAAAAADMQVIDSQVQLAACCRQELPWGQERRQAPKQQPPHPLPPPPPLSTSSVQQLGRHLQLLSMSPPPPIAAAATCIKRPGHTDPGVAVAGAPSSAVAQPASQHKF